MLNDKYIQKYPIWVHVDGAYGLGIPKKKHTKTKTTQQNYCMSQKKWKIVFPLFSTFLFFFEKSGKCGKKWKKVEKQKKNFKNKRECVQIQNEKNTAQNIDKSYCFPCVFFF